jgi:two-component system LytT family sensor kinase
MNGLLNVVGLTIGLALYAMLLAMVIGARHQRGGIDHLALATALLGLAWNLCALYIYEYDPVTVWIAVCGFSALGFLPAVVVHSVVRGEGRGRRARVVLRTMAYGASSMAVMLHAEAALARHSIPSVLGLQLLTVCFIGMLGPLALLTRGQPGARRALWGVALAAFAVSALHLRQYDEGGAWPIELVGHQASIPLAVAILYQDYPFAFADLFLKRALILIALVASVSAALWLTGVGLGSAPTGDPRQIGALMALWVATALAYPWIAAASGWFVDSILLTRPDYRSIEMRLNRRLLLQDDASGVLDEVCAELAKALSAETVRWSEDDRDGPVNLSALVAVDAGRCAEVRIPVTEHPRYGLEIDGLTHGRRILSGDVTMLSAVAVLAARRIDSLRLVRERYAQQTREREIAQLATEAELRALRAQLNPHFLFNALTTIGYLIQAAPERAVDTLLRLTTLLRSVLKSEGEFTTLGRELELVDAYLAIERARFEHRLRVRIEVPAECREMRVPSLLIQPLVENAIKHGIAPTRAGGEVSITARMAETASGRVMTIAVRDTAIDPSRSGRRRGWTRGVGLSSVERRLACHYGANGTLDVRSDSPGSTLVEVTLPAPLAAEAATPSSAEAAEHAALMQGRNAG